jgi:hypothetical protein
VRSKSQARFLGEGDGSNAIPLPGKAQFDHWRSIRPYIRQPIPEDLRHAALEMSQRYSPALVGRILKLDPQRLKKPVPKPARQKTSLKKPQTAFFKLPTEVILPKPDSSVVPAATGCRVLLERPDGARLTLMLPSLDLTEINRLCSDFWRS